MSNCNSPTCAKQIGDLQSDIAWLREQNNALHEACQLHSTVYGHAEVFVELCEKHPEHINKSALAGLKEALAKHLSIETRKILSSRRSPKVEKETR